MHFSLVSKMACGQVLPRIGNFIFPGLEQLRCPLLKLISKHISWTLSSASELIGTELLFTFSYGVSILLIKASHKPVRLCLRSHMFKFKVSA